MVELPDAVPDESPHYIRAVTAFGEDHPIVATEDIYASNGTKLLASGSPVNETLVERLARHKLRTPLDHSLAAADQLSARALAEDASQFLSKTPLIGRVTARTGDPQAVRHLLVTLDLPKPLWFRLTVMRARHADLFRHSLQAALVSHAIGLVQGLRRDDLRALLIAALCHDLGEMHTDPALLAPGRLIQPHERRHIHVHPITGHLVLRDLYPEAPRASLTAVLQHHERLDGSGYPHGLRGELIAPLSRIVALAEMAATMLRRDHPQRLDVMLRLNHSRLDPRAVGALRELLRPEYRTQHAPPSDARLESQFLLVSNALDAWRTFQSFLEQVAPDGASLERDALAFLNERMRELRSMLLQAGIDANDFESCLLLAREDLAVHVELEATLGELLRRMADIANEIERRAPRLDDLAQVTLASLIDALRTGNASRTAVPEPPAC